jgi:hypothetical protein
MSVGLSEADAKVQVPEADRRQVCYQVKGYFKALPNPADHPVFRIERLSGVDSKRS